MAMDVEATTEQKIGGDERAYGMEEHSSKQQSQ